MQFTCTQGGHTRARAPPNPTKPNHAQPTHVHQHHAHCMRTAHAARTKCHVCYSERGRAGAHSGVIISSSAFSHLLSPRSSFFRTFNAFPFSPPSPFAFLLLSSLLLFLFLSHFFSPSILLHLRSPRTLNMSYMMEMLLCCFITSTPLPCT